MQREMPGFRGPGAGTVSRGIANVLEVDQGYHSELEERQAVPPQNQQQQFLNHTANFPTLVHG